MKNTRPLLLHISKHLLRRVRPMKTKGSILIQWHASSNMLKFSQNQKCIVLINFQISDNGDNLEVFV